MDRQRGPSRIFLIIASMINVMAHSHLLPTLNAHHPDSYFVKESDTLSDISSIFLEDLWLWPELWRANPHIHNPHLIYPSDNVHVVSNSNRQHPPYLTLIRDNTANHSGASSHSPNNVIETDQHALPIIQALSPLLSQPLLMETSQYAQAAQIIGAHDPRLMYSQGDEVYVTGNEALPKNQIYAIVRAHHPLFDPVTDELLGYPTLHIGEGIITRSGDIASLKINNSFREVLPGDRLLNIENIQPLQNWPTSVTHEQLDAQIIALPEALSHVGSYQIVIINAGHQHQLSPGQLLSIRRHINPSHLNNIRLHKTNTKTSFDLPFSTHKTLGTALAFRVFEKVSYGLILSAKRPIRIGDRVGNNHWR